jgi:hypothetical protein
MNLPSGSDKVLRAWRYLIQMHLHVLCYTPKFQLYIYVRKLLRSPISDCTNCVEDCVASLFLVTHHCGVEECASLCVTQGPFIFCWLWRILYLNLPASVLAAPLSLLCILLLPDFVNGLGRCDLLVLAKL